MGSKLPNPRFAGLFGAIVTVLGALGGPASAQAPPARAVSAADGGAPAVGYGSPDGPALMRSAILGLESRRSISARIRQSIDLFGAEPAASGIYLEQRSERQLHMRLELRIQTGDKPSSILQVCDGSYLWTYKKLSGEESLDKVDVVRVARELEERGRLPEPGKIGWWPGLGGMPRMLRGLNAAFEFQPGQQVQLRGLPAWKLVGRWKPGRLAKMLPDQAEAIEAGQAADLSGLPEYLPQKVVLYLGADDRFPYRVDYLREKAAKDGGGDVLIVGIEFYDVKLNVPIDASQFIYQPGDLDDTDRTDEFLKSLGVWP